MCIYGCVLITFLIISQNLPVMKENFQTFLILFIVGQLHAAFGMLHCSKKHSTSEFSGDLF